VTINGQIYKGDLDGEDIFEAICASFSSQYKPLQCLAEYNLAKDLELHNATTDFRTSGERYRLLGVLFLVLLFNVCALYVYRRWQQRKQHAIMQEQVQQHVGQYFAMRQQPDKE